MKLLRQIVFDSLSDMKIDYDVVEHTAVYTIEEMDNLCMDNKNQVIKNLFIRDDKKKRYFLLSVQKDKKIDLKNLKTKLNSRPLSFASETALYEILKLSKGAVTPFGVLNDVNRRVEVVLDESLRYFDRIGIHPNDNTATIFIKPSDLELVIKKHGNSFSYIEL